ncbi:MAG: glycosyltransferase family 2 protein [Alloprevotella sp.]
MNRIAHLARKVALAIIETPKFFFPPKKIRLGMTLLVKNEADILETNLRFHRAMGVDFFIVTDNNSTDATPEIIERYQQKGWIKAYIRETDSGYEQKKWVDRMTWMEKRKYDADWIINADADELWYAPSGSLKHEMAAAGLHNVLRCQPLNVYPEEGKPLQEWNRVIRQVEDAERFNLSRFTIFSRQRPKVAHRAAGYIQISFGNHKVTMFPFCRKTADIRIYHYNCRGKDKFMEKAINGGKELETHQGKHGGRHWRFFYELYKEGKLEAEYDRVVGTNCLDELEREGYLCEDNTMPDFFRTMS